MRRSLPSIILSFILLSSLFGFGFANQQGSQYGPVKAGETLWAIAQKTRPNSSISIPQMMRMIQKANPQAFKSKSATSLLKGSMLTIPNQNQTQQKQAKRNALLKQLARQKSNNNDIRSLAELKKELSASKAKFQVLERRNQQIMEKMQSLHMQLRDLQMKMLEKDDMISKR